VISRIASPKPRHLSVANHNATRRPAPRMTSVRRADQSAHDPIRIVLIEDNRLARDQFTALLGRHPSFKVVATAASATTGLAHVQETKPHVALVDAGLGKQESHLCLNGAKQVAPGARVILMNLLPVQEDIIAFIKAGASGFILKDATVNDFLETIRSVAEGTDVVPASLTSALLSYIADQASVAALPPPAAPHLTKREREITHLIAEGLSNKEIAQRLNIATYTVKSHIHNVMEKLAVHSRVQVAAHTHWAGARTDASPARLTVANVDMDEGTVRGRRAILA